MRGDIESVKKGIATALSSTNFSDALAAVNAEQNDGYTTPGLQKVYTYERARIEAYPAAELQGLTTTYAPDDDLKNATHAIAIVFTQVGDNEAAVTTDIERLVRAARDLLWRSTLDGQSALAPMLVQSEDYGPLAPGNGFPFIKGGHLIVAAQTLT